MITLTVEKRAGGAPDKIRSAGMVPAVVYGSHQESTPISVESRAFDKVLKEAGEATVVSLVGLGSDLPVLIHEVDLDPLTSRPRHVDFYAIVKGEKVEVDVPLEFVGESDAVKGGANLVKVLHELPVKADPMSLPHNIEVDISALVNVGDQIKASDLKIPAGVELMIDAEEVVALAQEVKEEVVEAAAPADLSTIEVEKKGKEEAPAEGAE